MALSDDSIMVFPVCPHCFKHDVAFYFKKYSSLFNNSDGVYFLTCGNCKHGVCVEMDYTCYTNGEYKNFLFSNVKNAYPKPPTSEAPQFTPEDIASDFIEAKSSLKHGNIKAACMMARSAIESAVIERGGDGKNLSKDIDKLASNHVITQTMADWAHEIREIGNDAAHSAARNSNPTSKDAEDTIYFAEMLFTYLYTLPGQIAERRAHEDTEEE